MDVAIAVTGAYGKQNLGDDILMNAVLASIRDVVPASDICVQTGPAVDYLVSWHPGVCFLPVNSGETVRAELLIYGGGTQFCAYAKTRNWFERIIRGAEYSLHPVKSWRRLCSQASNGSAFNRIAGISLGVGPFQSGSRIERDAHTRLRRFDWLSVRDSFSLEYCRQLGITHTRLNADLGFAPGLWGAGRTGMPARRDRIERLGVVVRHWPYDRHGGRYIGPLREAVGQIRATGLSVEYISFAPRQDEKLVSLLRAHGDEVRCWDPTRGSIADFVTGFGEFDLVISGRAHGLILGAVLGIPSIAIEVEPKLRLIAASLKGGSELWPQPFEKDVLLDRVETISRNWRACRDTASCEAARCASEALRSASQLREYAVATVGCG